MVYTPGITRFTGSKILWTCYRMMRNAQGLPLLLLLQIVVKLLGHILAAEGQHLDSHL